MKKIKKILIFTFITVLSFLSFVLPLSVSAQTETNELNNSTNSYELKPMSIKIYLYEHVRYTGDATYFFDFSSLDDFYDYFIFNIGYKDIYTDGVIAFFQPTNNGYGIKIIDRNDLEWEIYFDENFNHYNYYILATNYDYIYNLPNNLLNEYTDGALYGYDVGYGEGVFDGIEIGYDDGYDDGYDLGYNEGYDYGVYAAGDYSFYSIISQVFTGIGTFLAIELLPNITFGAIFAVPLVFGIIFFIIGKRGGKDD